MDANDLVRWNGGLSALIKGARSFEPTSTVRSTTTHQRNTACVPHRAYAHRRLARWHRWLGP